MQNQRKSNLLNRPLLSLSKRLGYGHSLLHPHQKIFPQEKNEIYQRGPNLEVDFRYTKFFLASDPPSPPGIISTSH